MRVARTCLIALCLPAVLASCSGSNSSHVSPPPADSSPPVIMLSGDDPQIIMAGDPYTELGATATDNVDGALGSSITINASEVDTQVPGTYAVTYDVVDAAGNAAVTAIRTVIVRDETSPVITLLGDNPLVITTNDSYTEYGAMATDDVDGDLSGSIVIDARAVDTTIVGEYSVTYNVSDSARNAADTVTRIVEVLAPTPDFAHVGTPHVMGKNPFALPSQLDQFQVLEPRFGQVSLMVILLEFPDSQHNPAHTIAYFEDLIFGDDPSVNGYFDEVSYGLFSFRNAGITDWLMAPSPASYYFDPLEADNQYTALAAVAVQAAVNAGVDFDAYDHNADGKVTRDELQILIPMANHPGLSKPNLMATRFDQQVSQGVATQAGMEVDTWAVRVEENTNQDDRRVYVTFYAHELAHLALGLPDLYNDNFGEDPAGQFSPMAAAYTTYSPHVSPWAKIHLGWITPTVIEGCGLYEINPVESVPEAYILHTPSHGVKEYFIVENRWPAASIYMSHADGQENLDRGLAIWHITEYYDDEPSNFLKGRKMIGMKWAGGATSLDTLPYEALWDCSEASSCYDLTEVSVPRNSHWQGDIPSGIELIDISNAGEVMTVNINRTDGC